MINGASRRDVVNFRNALLLALGLVPSLFLVLTFMPSDAQALPAAGDIVAVRILPDGWSAEVDLNGFTTGGTYDLGLGTTNDPTNAKIVFTVISQGYDQNGILGTVTRTVYGTKWVRKPYPDSTINSHVPDERVAEDVLTVRVSLSDYVYADDKNGGAGTSGADVAVSFASGWYTDNGSGGTGLPSNSASLTAINNSLMDYPKVIGRWAWPGYERVTNDFLVETVAFHRFAQDGKPIARIDFEAMDKSGNKFNASATDMTISSRTGDANKILVYAATMDIDPLNQGEVIEVNFRAYPWVGDENSILDSRTTADGFAQPEERLGPLYELNDKNGTYGGGFALVSNSGNDSLGKVYNAQTDAEVGNPYLTIEKAAEGIRTYNAVNHGRDSAGGGVILLAEGNYSFPGTSTTALGQAMSTWLTVKRASNAQKSNTVIGPSNGTFFKGTLLKVEGLSLSSSGTLLNGNISAALWLHDNAINLTGNSPFYYFKTGYATHNQITTLKQGFSPIGGKTVFALVRGNSADIPTKSSFYTVLGNKNITGQDFAETSNGRGLPSDNSIFAFNSIYQWINTLTVARSTEISKGIAIVQNLFESTADVNTGFAIMFLSADNENTASNIILWHNTFVGQRTGLGYNSVGSVPYYRINWSEKYNIYEEYGKKTDTLNGPTGPNGNRIGNWSTVYNAGSIGNFIVKNAFMSDFDGIYSKAKRTSTIQLNPEYVDNRSGTGSGFGNGDYTLLPTSAAINMSPASTQFGKVLPYDLLGYARTGDPDAGAYEYQSSSDVTVPVLSGGEPTGILPEGTRQTTVSITTDEAATCKYGIVPDTLYGSIANTFAVTGGTSHSSVISGLSDATSYDYYIRCQDTVGNANPNDFQISFAVAAPTDTVAPRLANILYHLNDSTVDITLTFSETVNTTDATLTTNTGGSCAFSIASATSAVCSYTIGAGENLAGFHVTGFTGTIADPSGNSLSAYVPEAWDNKSVAF